MERVQVFLHGQLLSELLLKAGETYYAGRGSQCHIILANERGISRQHIHFFQKDDQWVAQSISKYGGLVMNDEIVGQVELKHGQKFSVPPYEFQFIGSGESPATQAVEPDHTIAVQPEPVPTEKPNENTDATAVYHATLTAYLKVVNNKLKTEEVFKLEGDTWVAGRSPDCEVAIADSSFSRRHLEISHKDSQYFVTDLASSNGTLLNGEALVANIKAPLSSGDVLTVKQIELLFELHDGDFSQRLKDLAPVEEDFESLGNDYGELQSAAPGEDAPTVLRIPPAKSIAGLPIKPIHGIIAVLICVLVYGLFTGGEKSPKSGEKDSASTKAKAELTPDKLKEVSDTFNLAQNYYMQRKFVLCISQLEKLHGLVPFYQNSKELDSLCRQARELEQIELDRKRKEDERVSAENKIRKTVEECRQMMKPSTTLAEMNICLQPAMELDPQNPSIVDLQTQLSVKELQLADQKAKAAEWQQRRQRGLAAFDRAMNLLKSGQLKPALSSFKQFLSGDYPGLEQKEVEAKRQIASIESSIQQKLNELSQNCTQAGERADHKSAIVACDLVLKEDPSHEKAKAQRMKSLNSLKKEMKVLYDDAALEESLGNIESAKEKWLKIKQSSLPAEDYFKKAQKKLGKYGLGYE